MKTEIRAKIVNAVVVLYLVVIGVSLLVQIQTQKIFEGIQGIAALGNLIFAGMLFFVSKKQTELQEHSFVLDSPHVNLHLNRFDHNPYIEFLFTNTGRQPFIVMKFKVNEQNVLFEKYGESGSVHFVVGVGEVKRFRREVSVNDSIVLEIFYPSGKVFSYDVGAVNGNVRIALPND